MKEYGPSFCEICGSWPAARTAKGLRCHVCECRDICADNPVPLPKNPQMLRDLASIGVPGAAEKLMDMNSTPSKFTVKINPADCDSN